MKVIHRTAKHLVIEDKPWLIGLMMIGMALVFLFGSMKLLADGEVLGGSLLGLVGVGVPLVIGAVMVQRVRVVFDRTTGEVRRTCRSVRGLTEVAYPLDRISHASLGVSTDSDSTTYRLELALKGPVETLPFTTYYTSGRRPDHLCSEVNEWLGEGTMPSAAKV
jgi:hypothetical protein